MIRAVMTYPLFTYPQGKSLLPQDVKTTPRFQRSWTDFLNSAKFICLYLFYVVVLLRGTNEITLVLRRIETFIRDVENVVASSSNQLNREIWFCKDFTGVTILKWNLTKYSVIRETIWLENYVVKNEMFHGKFVHAVSCRIDLPWKIYNIFQEAKYIFLTRVTNN